MKNTDPGNASESTLKFEVLKVVFRGKDGFAVLVGNDLASKQECTVVGTFPDTPIFTQLCLKGRWVQNPRFGRQFEANKYLVQLPTESAGIEKFLAQGFAKGIGKATAEKIVAKFGGKTLEVLEKDPAQLLVIPGISDAKLNNICTAWGKLKDLSTILVPLMEIGISRTLANKLLAKYGQNVLAVIRSNPYLLISDMWGIGFLRADEIALKAGIKPDAPERLKAAISHVLKAVLDAGSLYLEIGGFWKQYLQLLKLEPNKEIQSYLEQALHELINQKVIRKLDWHGKEIICFEKVFLAEAQVADMLKKIIATSVAKNISDTAQLLRDLQSASGTLGNIALSLQQEQAVCIALTNKITIITGGPGTGKTTMLRTLLGELQKRSFSFLLAAPTGRAAKRMQQATSCFAQTLHRLLEYNPIARKFEKNFTNPLKTDFIIIDEFSMIDLFLIHALLAAVNAKATRLVLVGDVDQLPSVGPGRILGDLINSKIIPVVRLTKIFRQDGMSLIVENAHRVNASAFPIASSDGFKKDFFLLKMETPESFTLFLEKHYQRMLTNYELTPEQSVVLTPMHKGIVGSINVNSQLQRILNPDHVQPAAHHTSITVGAYHFKVGDPVMQRHNNYDKAVFNGDIGKISAIKTLLERQIVEVTYDGRVVTYEVPLELSQLTLAYAISIHKSQGSEFAAVVIPIFTQHFMMLSKNVLYTAITRAKKICFLVGQTKAIAIAVKNDKPSERVTLLCEFLTDQINIDYAAMDENLFTALGES